MFALLLFVRFQVKRTFVMTSNKVIVLTVGQLAASEGDAGHVSVFEYGRLIFGPCEQTHDLCWPG